MGIRNKNAGIILFLIATLIVLILARESLLSFINEICLCPTLEYKLFAFLLTPLMWITTLFMYIRILRNKEITKNLDNKKINIENNSVGINLDELNENEKKICLLLNKNGGEMLQRDIVIETKLPPYTVSRTLIKLNAYEITETKRYGMTKKIILKKC